MNIEKIEINGHYVWVDKDAEIKEEDWCMSLKDRLGIKSDEFMKSLSPFRSIKNYKSNEYIVKIIAASPELNLDGVPTYMEKEQIIKAFNQSWHDRMNPYKTADKYYKETFKSE